ncbi:uncharacterized protein YjbI with pentapeptide repeats [Labrenzia sp. EL_195]|nr:uncharacterized protein YjbI with pentapeptide repeats [Labrenzia sp. EL_195]
MAEVQGVEPGAELLKEVEAKLAHIEAVSKNARGTWLSLIVVMLFSVIAVAGVRDKDHFTFDAALVLPIIGVSVPIVSFFVAGPVLVLGLYTYLHLYLIKLWRALAEVDVKTIDGVWLDDLVFPWLINDAAIFMKPGAPTRPFGWLTQLVSLIFLWLAAPCVLGLFWLRSFPPHNGWLTAWVGSLTALSVLGGAISIVLWFRILRTGREDAGNTFWNEQAKHVVEIWSVFAFVLLIEGWAKSTGGIESRYITLGGTGHIYSANLFRAELVDRPKDWKSRNEAWAEFKAKFAGTSRREQFENGDPTADWIIEARTSFNRQREEQLAWLRVDDFIERDFRNAYLEDAFLPGLDLTSADLRGADLSFAEIEGIVIEKARLEGVALRGLDLTILPLAGINLRGADLREANLAGSVLQNTILVKADIRKVSLLSADLTGADLRQADLRQANLREANLRRADLREAVLRQTDLRQADLREADLREADLREANLRQVDLFEADLREADLREADLFEADLTGADLRQANLSKANLREADLTRAKLRQADLRAGLREADLTGADLRQAVLSHSNMFKAVLRQAYLLEADLRRANLFKADLFEADLTDADLTGAKLMDANLFEANLSGTVIRSVPISGALLVSADLSDNDFVTQLQINSAYGDGSTKLPERLDRPLHWPAEVLLREDITERWQAWREGKNN